MALKSKFTAETMNSQSLFDLVQAEAELAQLTEEWRRAKTSVNSVRDKIYKLNAIATFIGKTGELLKRTVPTTSDGGKSMKYLLQKLHPAIRMDCIGQVFAGCEYGLATSSQSPFTSGNPISLARRTFDKHVLSDDYRRQCDEMQEDLAHVNGARLAFDLEGVLVSTSYRKRGFKAPTINLLRPGANEILEALHQNRSNQTWVWTSASDGLVTESMSDGGLSLPASADIVGREMTAKAIDEATLMVEGNWTDFWILDGRCKIPRFFPGGDLDVLVDDKVSEHLEGIAEVLGEVGRAEEAKKMIQINSFAPRTAQAFRSAHLDTELFKLAKKLRERFS